MKAPEMPPMTEIEIRFTGTQVPEGARQSRQVGTVVVRQPDGREDQVPYYEWFELAYVGGGPAPAADAIDAELERLSAAAQAPPPAPAAAPGPVRLPSLGEIAARNLTEQPGAVQSRLYNEHGYLLPQPDAAAATEEAKDEGLQPGDLDTILERMARGEFDG